MIEDVFTEKFTNSLPTVVTITVLVICIVGYVPVLACYYLGYLSTCLPIIIILIFLVILSEVRNKLRGVVAIS